MLQLVAYEAVAGFHRIGHGNCFGLRQQDPFVVGIHLNAWEFPTVVIHSHGRGRRAPTLSGELFAAVELAGGGGITVVNIGEQRDVSIHVALTKSVTVDAPGKF